MTLHPCYANSATEDRAVWLWERLDDTLALTRSDVVEAVEAATDTVYEQHAWRPDLENDSAWEIVLPETLIYLSEAHNIDMSTFDHIAY